MTFPSAQSMIISLGLDAEGTEKACSLTSLLTVEDVSSSPLLASCQKDNVVLGTIYNINLQY